MGKFTPEFLVVDYETALLSGQASTEAYRKDFRVTTCAFSWLDEAGEIKRIFLVGEDETRKMLERAAEAGIPLIAHNIQYEILVTMCRFPEVMGKLKWQADTMRLVQVYDNGGKMEYDPGVLSIEEELDKAMAELEGREYTSDYKGPPMGIGLDSAVRRILPKKYHGHKKEAHDWIRANTSCGKKNRPGKYLHLLPMDIMKRYNIGDTENTLRLYMRITQEFKQIGYDYTLDHGLFMGSVWSIVKAKIRGVGVDREQLAGVIDAVTEQLWEIEQSFLSRFKKEVAEVERQRVEKWVDEPKTEKGKDNRRARIEEDRAVSNPRCKDPKNKWDVHGKFNVGSNKQLQTLFVDLLGMKPKFFTPKGSPSFKSPALPQWGDGGMLLGERRKRLLVLKQATNLHILSGYDGRFHLDLKTCGTATGRFAGGQH